MAELIEIKSELHKYLHPYFEHKKYVLEAGLGMFYRQTRFGHSSVVCSISGSPDRYYVQFFLGIRHSLIENLLTNLFGMSMYYNSLSHTVLPSWHFLNKRKGPVRLPFKEPENITVAGDMLINFMDGGGFDFLDAYKSLQKLDYILNDKPAISAQWANHNYHRCFRAMAAAKITGRNDFGNLFQMHRQYLDARGFSGEIISKFEITFANLKSISLN